MSNVPIPGTCTVHEAQAIANRPRIIIIISSSSMKRYPKPIVTSLLPWLHLLLLRRRPSTVSAFLLLDVSVSLSPKRFDIFRLTPERPSTRQAMVALSSSRTFEEGTVSVKRFASQQPSSAFSSVIPRRKKKRRTEGNDDNDDTDSKNSRATTELSMYYRIFNPDYLIETDEAKRKEKAPLVVVHGGPSLPSQYLYSIADNMPQDRPIIFYDQIGCGRSSEPRDISSYGISQSVDDLEILIDELELESFHILGHSYGGVLAYEHAKRVTERDNAQQTSGHQCLSVVLANTPTNMQKGNNEWERLLNECAADSSLPGATPDDKFFRRNQCRLDDMPQDLSSAFNHCGKVWFGTDVVADWVAKPLEETGSMEGERGLPPFLLITGQYDFITQSCTSGWKGVLGDDALAEETMMKDCSHYVHFEQPAFFGSILEDFVSRWEA